MGISSTGPMCGSHQCTNHPTNQQTTNKQTKTNNPALVRCVGPTIQPTNQPTNHQPTKTNKPATSTVKMCGPPPLNEMHVRPRPMIAFHLVAPPRKPPPTLPYAPSLPVCSPPQWRVAASQASPLSRSTCRTTAGQQGRAWPRHQQRTGPSTSHSHSSA